MFSDMTGADWISAGSALIGAGKPAASGAAADSIFATNTQFDNSGWNVAFAGSKIESSAEKTANQSTTPTTNGAAMANINQYLPYAVLFVAALVAWKMLKK